MIEDIEASQGKSVGELGREAFWFVAHTFIAVFVLAILLAVMTFMHPNPDSSTPKLIATGLAFLVPLIAGFILSKVLQNDIARYVWISGLLLFSVVCVWVLDLPTGPGLCEHCGLVERLYRTFFFIDGNSGLMGGDGLLVGTWIPLSMIGYAIGAHFGLKDEIAAD